MCGLNSESDAFPVLNAEAVHTLRLMCTPGALLEGTTVTITAFKDAFDTPSVAEGISGSPSAQDLLAQPALQAPSQCAVTVATTQHCLALAGLALQLLSHCLRLQPTACAELVPREVVIETMELMEYGDIELQVCLFLYSATLAAN